MAWGRRRAKAMHAAVITTETALSLLILPYYVIPRGHYSYYSWRILSQLPSVLLTFRTKGIRDYVDHQ